MAKRWKPTDGAGFNSEMAQVLGKILESLGNTPTPKQLVDAARPVKSPIHKLFEWDDTKAAERFRIYQARNHINHIEVEIVHEGKSTFTKAYHSVIVETENEGKERAYKSVAAVRSNKEYAEQVVENARDELRYWRTRYEEYGSVFGGVFKEADKVIANGKPKKRRPVRT